MTRCADAVNLWSYIRANFTFTLPNLAYVINVDYFKIHFKVSKTEGVAVIKTCSVDDGTSRRITLK